MSRSAILLARELKECSRVDVCFNSRRLLLQKMERGMGGAFRGLHAGLLRRQGPEQTEGQREDKRRARSLGDRRMDSAGPQTALDPQDLPYRTVDGRRVSVSHGSTLVHGSVDGGSQVSCSSFDSGGHRSTSSAIRRPFP